MPITGTAGAVAGSESYPAGSVFEAHRLVGMDGCRAHQTREGERSPRCPRCEMCSGSEAGSYLRLIDSCITQLKAQGPSRTCNESKEEEKKVLHPILLLRLRVRITSFPHTQKSKRDVKSQFAVIIPDQSGERFGFHLLRLRVGAVRRGRRGGVHHSTPSLHRRLLLLFRK